MHPALVRHVISPLLERCLGRDTFARYARIRGNETVSVLGVRRVQQRKLTALLRHSGVQCPYYQRLFDKLAIAPGDSDPIDTLGRLPLLDKDTIRRYRDALTDHGVPGGPIPFTTGGSTGDPLHFYIDRQRIAADKAARMATHAWFGVRPGDREVYLWAAPVELRAQDRARQFRDRITNELLLSAFAMTPAAMHDYLRRLQDYQPAALFGYPSSIAKLVEFAHREGVAPPRAGLKAIFVTGEKFEETQRREIHDYFAVPVADSYGSRDGGFIAHECAAGSMHVIEPHVIVEVVDVHGNPLPPGEVGEIVVTHLESRAMPLLRYRTGDLGAFDSGPCPCGRSWRRLSKVAGRQTDHLIAEDGAMQHGLSAIHVIREIASVRAFQIKQRADRSIEALVAPAPGFSARDVDSIRRGLRHRLGQSLHVDVRIVDSLPVAASGKFRQVTSDATGCGRLPAAKEGAQHEPART